MAQVITNPNVRESGPAADCFAITPSDTVKLAKNIRGIYVGGTGDIVLTNAAGVTVTFAGCPTGYVLPVQAVYVNAATTATYLVGLV